jgi:hypothetical protein
MPADKFVWRPARLTAVFQTFLGLKRTAHETERFGGYGETYPSGHGPTDFSGFGRHGVVVCGVVAFSEIVFLPAVPGQTDGCQRKKG